MPRQALRDRGQCDVLVAKLVIEMEDVLQHVAAIRGHAKIAKLQDTIQEILLLVEDASRFVIEYRSDGATSTMVRTIRAFASSSAQDQVDKFVRGFARLKENLDREIAAQVVQRVETLLDDADRALLEKLIVPGAGYDLSRCCLEGTRTEILQDIRNWTLTTTGSTSLFWLYGPAGCGKSSVATSMSDWLRTTGNLGGSFFCSRDNENLRKPENVISQLAASLGYKRPAYGKKLVDALRNDPNIAHSKSTKTRFMDLMVDPLECVGKDTSLGTVTVVIDALDESGTAETRIELVKCLLKLLGQVDWLKILITSRPNDEIRRLLNLDQVRTESRNLFSQGETSVSRDIAAYIRSRLNVIPADVAGRDQWPDDWDIDRLTTSSNRLFIWARTACNMIQRSFDPSDTINQILGGQRSNDERKALGAIYTTALDEGLGATNNDTKIIQLCVGAIVLTGLRRPLPDAALAKMLSQRVKPHVLSQVINRLGSVLYRDDQSAVRVLHQSFSDYMTEADCPEQYRIDLPGQNAVLAASCLELMLRSLRFNICGLRDSRVMNHDVVDLQTRIEHKIPPELMYSCAYWTTHLVVPKFAMVSAGIIKLLDELLCGRHLLYWIEVQSLTNNSHTIMEGMSQLMDWIDDPKSRYTKVTADIYRFVLAASEVISVSTPHLYVSALPFGAANYATLEALKPSFPNTLSIARGANLWNSPCFRIMKAQGAINSISVSRNGRRIISGSQAATLQIWDTQTGASLVDSLQGHHHAVTSVAFSFDCRHVVSGSWDATVQLWDAHSGNRILDPLQGHYDRVTSVAFSPDGRRVVSGSEDRTVRIWDTQTGTASLNPLRGHSKTVLSVAFSHDGQRIVSGSRDTTLRVWDAQTGASILPPLRGHSHKVMSVTFSSDGRRIASGSGDKTVRLWNAYTGIAHLDPFRGHWDTVTSVAFSSDCRRVVSGSQDMIIRIWDVETGATLLEPFNGHSDVVSSVAFSPDGRSIVSGSQDMTVRIWDAQVGVALSHSLESHSHAVSSVAVSSDNRYIVSGSEDNTLRVWDAHTGTALLEPLKGHSDHVTSVALSPDGRYIASGSKDKTVQIWDAQTGASLFGPLKGHPFGVKAVSFSSDGRRVISCSANSDYSRWSGPLIWYNSPSEDRTVRIWDTLTGAELSEPLEHPNQDLDHDVISAAFSSDGQRIVSSCLGGTLQIWDAETGVALINPIEFHFAFATSVALSPDGSRIAAGIMTNGTLEAALGVWDTQTGVALVGPLAGHSDIVNSVAFSFDGQRIVSGSRDKTVRIWDAQTGAELLGPLQGHSGGVVSVTFSFDDRHVVSGSKDGTVRIWDALTSSPSVNIQTPLENSARFVDYFLSPTHT
ncbi:hypothetical protein FRC07_003982 [Ceratobasidium sp. 392]|nr:hypothetical protein FRC07_003982 [Ceratobasidium sp. 392]